MAKKNAPKTLIGVMASHDSIAKNRALAKVFEDIARPKNRRQARKLRKFRFVLTGGTYHRLLEGEQVAGATSPVKHRLSKRARNFLINQCGVVVLPRTEDGGVTLMAALITQRRISIVWPFLTPLTTHLYTPENQALLRLADQWHVKKLMNTWSVSEWIETEAGLDKSLNLQPVRLMLELPGSDLKRRARRAGQRRGLYKLRPKSRGFPDFGDAIRTSDWSDVTLALISHDEMKSRMQDFVTVYERKLGLFKRILATGTTGGLVQAAAPSLAKKNKVYRYHSGPKGGDIEIATEILLGRCHIVIFFVDPLQPHPHTDDIRVVFGACMIHDKVRMLSNEYQARAWMDRVVRGT